MKRILKACILFLVFGTIYFLIETIWKGHLTHWSMFVLAGVIGLLIGGINEYIPWEMPLLYQCGIGMCLATIGEGITGLIVNKWLNLHVWDYSHTPLNFFFAQCSIPFCIAWFFLSGLCIFLDDFIRWKIFNEEIPYYKLSLK